MTEDEAKQCWRPFARVAVLDTSEAVRASSGLPSEFTAAVNRWGDGPPAETTMCIGSQCMAWRWEPAKPTEHLIEAIKRYRDETGASLSASKDYVTSHPEYLTRPEPTDGHCGLAGKP